MGNNFFQQLATKYPFITVLSYASTEYVGIVQNHDNAVITLYNFGKIVEPHLKYQFLELANSWWWESNRSIPINLFLREEWAIFKPYLQTFVSKDVMVICGPCTSLLDLIKKRSKKKSIILVRQVL